MDDTSVGTTFFKSALVASLILASSPSAFAASLADADEADTQGYDQIVSELSREADRPVLAAKAKRAHLITRDPFENVWIHFGVGLASAVQTLSFADGNEAYLGGRGMQVAGGIDLFSPNWLAEGTYRGFAESESGPAKLALQEFELKLFYKNRISKTLGARVGGGLSGRYLSVKRAGQPDAQYTTPSSVLTFGGDLFMNDNISLGADLSARSAMISDTIDHGSFDATLRLDTHF